MEIIDKENQNRAIRLSVPGGYIILVNKYHLIEVVEATKTFGMDG